jgi:hypothetical protein
VSSFFFENRKKRNRNLHQKIATISVMSSLQGIAKPQHSPNLPASVPFRFTPPPTSSSPNLIHSTVYKTKSNKKHLEHKKRIFFAFAFQKKVFLVFPPNTIAREIHPLNKHRVSKTNTHPNSPPQPKSALSSLRETVAAKKFRNYAGRDE